MVTAAIASDYDPFYRLSLVIIASGAAGIVLDITTLTRAAATTTLPGPANFVLVTLELLGALGTTVAALLIP